MDYKNTKNKNSMLNTSNCSQDSNCANANKYDTVEPLPESSRPRRDGPGGEDAD